jgi:OFA family oxalate/formate antiporter-like MFS transporter
MVASLCVGFGYAWSVLLKPMEDEFGWSVSEVALSFTAIFVTGAVAALAAGKLMQYFQPRTLVLLGGGIFGAGLLLMGSISSIAELYGSAVLVGIGLGIVCPGATMSNGIRFFPDKRGLASGLLIAGYGLGAVVWAPIAVYLIDHQGLAWSLRTLGTAFFVAIAVCSRFIRTAPQSDPVRTHPTSSDSEPVEGQEADTNWRGMLRSPAFYLLATLFVIGTIGGNLVVGLASPIAQEALGISSVGAATVVSILALGLVGGKLVWGSVSDRTGRLLVFIVMFAVTGLALLVMSEASSYASLVVSMTTVGFCYGGFLALIGPTTADAFGQRDLPINYGIMFLTVAVSALVGPRLGTAIQQADGSFSLAFVIAAILNLIAVVISVLSTLLAGRHSRLLLLTRTTGPRS